MLKHDKLVDLDEQDYLAETRQILEGIFLHERQIDASVDQEDRITSYNVCYTKLLRTAELDLVVESLSRQTATLEDEVGAFRV